MLGVMRILIVEDEYLLSVAWAEALQAAGYEISGPAATAASAHEMIAEAGADACLLDANLRGNGSEPLAIELLRRGTPFVVVSGYPRSSLTGCLAAAPFLAKPVKAGELVRMLRSLLGQ